MVIMGWRIPKPFVYNYFFSSPRGANDSFRSRWLSDAVCMASELRCGLLIKWNLGRGWQQANLGGRSQTWRSGWEGKVAVEEAEGWDSYWSFISLAYSISISSVKHFSCWNWTIIKHPAKLASSVSRWEQEGAKSKVFSWTQLFKHIQAGEAWG